MVSSSNIRWIHTSTRPLQVACKPRNTELKLTLYSLATKKDVEDHFATHGTGVVKEIKLMNGFGFIEYEDAMDARDVVPGAFPSPCSVTLDLD